MLIFRLILHKNDQPFFECDTHIFLAIDEEFTFGTSLVGYCSIYRAIV